MFYPHHSEDLVLCALNTEKFIKAPLLTLRVKKRLGLSSLIKFKLTGNRDTDLIAYGGDLNMHICILSTYTPEKCGIAEYSSELARALTELGVDVSIIAVNQGIERRIRYPEEVEFVIRRNKLNDYVEAARYVNTVNFDAVMIQHEYGIFGGRWGSYLIEFLNEVDVPVITTLHTVINPPDDIAKRVTEQVMKLSNAITVMSRNSLNLLTKYYNIDEGKRIHVIPHGVRSIYVGDRDSLRRKLGISGKFAILTIGLLSPDKGIEYGIRAMKDIIKYVDNAIYMVVGEVHPKLRMKRVYRKKLRKLVSKLGLEDKVIFVDRFLTKEDYVKYIVACDVVLLPYVNEIQVSSGALSYALGYGKVTVSTPFIYAREMLANGRGLLCKFKDPKSIANAIVSIAMNPELRKKIEANALRYGLKLRWEYVSLRFLNLLASVVEEHKYKEVGEYVAPTYTKVS
ncbi:MAG: hypothetical protein DRJ66_05240 [Thermoprotei archaeon]|nr:MAG: hypothetical protein DRJ66_05240 [Thermoprotei archaeon]